MWREYLGMLLDGIREWRDLGWSQGRGRSGDSKRSEVRDLTLGWPRPWRAPGQRPFNSVISVLFGQLNHTAPHSFSRARGRLALGFLHTTTPTVPIMFADSDFINFLRRVNHACWRTPVPRLLYVFEGPSPDDADLTLSSLPQFPLRVSRRKHFCPRRSRPLGSRPLRGFGTCSAVVRRRPRPS